MKMHAILLLVLRYSLLCAAVQLASCDYRERIASESARFPALAESRIIGGEKATIEEYAFAVSLQNNGTFFGYEVEHFCGGSIIAEKWIITSAQCGLRVQGNKFHVRAGSSYYHKNGDIYNIESVTIHPAFNEINYDYDVALVKLSESIVFDDTKKPAVLPKLNVDIQDGEAVQALGWGASEYLGPVSEELLCHTMQKISNTVCQKVNGGNIVTSRMFCAVSDSASLCVGDSGSPIVYKDLVFGVASWSRSCAYQFPTTYTAISEVIDWITEVSGVA